MFLASVCFLLLFCFAHSQRRQSLPEACIDPLPGSPQCLAAFPGWKYNRSSSTCQQIIGCPVSQNFFDNFWGCARTCLFAQVSLSPNPECNFAFQPSYFGLRNTKTAWAYDIARGRCQQMRNYFSVVNNFYDRNTCVRSCVCSLRQDTGPCRANFMRYFYNSTSQTCDTFRYGGCQGNGNNFESKEECQKQCATATDNRKPVEPFELVSDIKPGRCPVIEAGICVELCESDTDCPGPQKCCQGCGHTCLDPEPEDETISEMENKKYS